jgi:transcriptional regulator with XRE-family HTH domain
MSFGAELRRFRMAAGLSLAELAKAVHYTKGYLSKVENSDKPPNPILARLCDATLGADGALMALLPQESQTLGEPRAEKWMLDIAADGTGRPVPATHPLCCHDNPLPVDPRRDLAATAGDDLTVEHYRARFNASVRYGESVSSRAVLPGVSADANMLWSMALVAPARTKPALLTLATLNATYTGWLAVETDDHQAAQRWSRTAVGLAEIVGDPNLIAYSLTREAGVAVFRDDPVYILALTDRIRSEPGVATRFRRIAADREAQGHALLGNYDLCRRALDRSTELSHEPDTPTMFDGVVLPPMAAAGPHVVGVISGWCLHNLGRPTAAVEVLDQEISGISSTHRRATARFGARRVLAHAAAGEVDHACKLAHELLDIAQIVDSATVRREFRELARTLARWHRHKSVVELQPRLTAVLRPPGSPGHQPTKDPRKR